MSKLLSTVKDHIQESQLYLNRTVAATAVVLTLFVLLIGRLAFLQIYQHDLYKTLSLNNQVRIVPITPPRGLIFDRDGIPLADNIPAFSLELIPEQNKNIDETLKSVQQIISVTPQDLQNFYKQLKYKRRNEGIPIRLKLTEEEVAQFALEKHNFVGVDVVARLIRHYPEGEQFAHVLGYIGPISEKDLEKIDHVAYRGTYAIGKTGIEQYYESTLHGKVGYQHIETDAKGRTIRVLNRIPPNPGTNITTSIDSALQKKAYEALGEFKGAVVAMNPKTGEVLAMVSKPSFDPNLFSQGIEAGIYRALQESQERPLFNRAIRGQYPPGSTVKPLVALQALDLNYITPQFGIFDPGWYQLHAGGRLFRDWIFFSKRHGHGWVDLEKAIAQSCDTYFFTIAHKLGINHLQDIYTRFGLGKPTGIDMSGEASGIVPSAEWKLRHRKEAWYAGDTLNVGIGQGMMLATPLQMAQVATMLANRGNLVQPRLVLKSNEPLANAPTVRLQHPEHWERVIQGMQRVVDSPGGTAFRATQGIPYHMAGKTGTSQVFNLKQNEKYEISKVKSHLRDHSWFIAFAPVENPEIAIAVLVENKIKKTGAHVAREVLDHYFNVKKVNTINDQSGIRNSGSSNNTGSTNITGSTNVNGSTNIIESSKVTKTPNLTDSSNISDHSQSDNCGETHYDEE